jgi:uncharacterized protein involved in exopolysaccharide biosynthesis
MQTAITHVARGNLTPRAGLEAMFRQRRLFAIVACTVFLLSALATLVRPRQYSSEMKFLVQNNRGNVVITPEKTTATTVVSDVNETQVNSELEILHSHDVLDPVADPGWSQFPEARRDLAALRNHEKLIAAFERRFATDIIRKTNVIMVTVRAESAERAHSDLERLCAAYLAEHRRLQRPPGASEFFKTEAERIRKDWDEASQALVAFQQQHQIVSLPEREATLNKQLAERERDLAEADANIRELDAQLAASATRLRELPMRQTTVERILPNQQSTEHLNTLLVELENKRTALLTNFKASDRFVHELDQQIETTKAAMAAAAAGTAREKSTDVDPAWQQLHTSYIQAEISRKQSAVHRDNVAIDLSHMRQDLARAQELTVQFNNLEARASQAKQNFDLYAQKRDQAQIEDAMDEQKLINVAVAQQPTLSYAAISPKPLSNLVLGAATSFFLAICGIYLAESGRNTIATPRELDCVSRYPVLATLPRISLWEGPILESGRVKTKTAGALPQSVNEPAKSREPVTIVKGASA